MARRAVARVCGVRAVCLAAQSQRPRRERRGHMWLVHMSPMPKPPVCCADAMLGSVIYIHAYNVHDLDVRVSN
eukprot:6441854-Prymnesium_polylepis.1